MNILLATYSYYPYNWGGTEVYVSGLADYLNEKGHTVMVIAAMPDTAFADHPIFYEDAQLRTVSYRHNNIQVIGVSLKGRTVTEIYTKFRQQWLASWYAVLKETAVSHWDILHIHANTAAIGESLVKAAKSHSHGIKVIASCHVPLSCVKGTLVYANSLDECRVRATVHTCTACFISDRQDLPVGLTKIITALMPRLANEKLPTGIRIKYLADQFIQSFHAFDKDIDQWHVFSEYIRQIWLLNGIDLKKITLLRHGVNPHFFISSTESITARQKDPVTKFLYVGRLDKAKGFFTLLKAWCELPEEPGRELWILSERQNGEAEDEHSRKASLRSDIKWMGAQSQESTAAIMKKVHCTVIPSEWIEIGPLVLHESVAAGADVIASDIGGCRELAAVYKDKCGLFKAGNKEMLKRSITAFKYSGIKQEPLLQQMNYAMAERSYYTLHATDQKVVDNKN